MTTAAGLALTEAHRIAQARLSAQTVARLVQVWPLLDSSSIDATTARWLTAATPIVEQSHTVSQSLAAAYLRQFRTAETGAATGLIVPAVFPVAEQITTSLLVQGPIALKKAIGVGRPVATAFETAAYTSSVAGTRQALAGGRDVIIRATEADPQAYGMHRVTSSGACEFCLQIARYSETNPNLGGNFQCHDNCHCQPVPLYR